MRQLGITPREAEYLARVGGWVKLRTKVQSQRKHLMRAKVLDYDGRGRLTIQLANHKRPELVSIDDCVVWLSRTEEAKALQGGA